MPGPSKIKMPQPKPATIGGNAQYSHTLYHAVMSPLWLKQFAELDDAVRDAQSQDNVLELKVDQDRTEYENLLTVKLIEDSNFPRNSDYMVKITAMLDHDNAVYDPLSIVISDGCKAEPHSSDYAIGFQIRDPSEYTKIGPYQGIEGKPGSVLASGNPIIAKEGQETLVAHQDRLRWPQMFQITLLPFWSWGTCYSPIAGGHCVSAKYSDQPDQLVNPSAKRGLFLELYRGGPKETYRLDSLEVEVSTMPDYTNPNALH